jgi:hypothetical protein
MGSTRPIRGPITEESAMPDHPNAVPVDPERQRRELEEAQRRAHAKHPKNFQDEALEDKQVRIEPDGIGPTSTGTMDTESDQRDGSGNDPKV